jgi:hypothetical protein
VQSIEYSIFKIPPLGDHASQILDDTEPPSPLLRIVCPLEGALCSTQSIWNPGTTSTQTPFYFDSVGGDDGGTTTIARYALKRIDNKLSDGLPSNIPILVDYLRNEDIASDFPRFRAYQPLHNTRLSSWVSGTTLRLHWSTTPTPEGRPTARRSGILWQWPRPMLFQDDVHYAFCPLAGRLCVSSWDHEIRVLDYVIPPN